MQYDKNKYIYLTFTSPYTRSAVCVNYSHSEGAVEFLHVKKKYRKLEQLFSELKAKKSNKIRLKCV